MGIKHNLNNSLNQEKFSKSQIGGIMTQRYVTKVNDGNFAFSNNPIQNIRIHPASTLSNHINGFVNLPRKTNQQILQS